MLVDFLLHVRLDVPDGALGVACRLPSLAFRLLAPVARRTLVRPRIRDPMASSFRVDAPFKPAGDQPEAIAQLVEGVQSGLTQQVLAGVTGSGKTNVMAWAVEQLQRPVLVLSPNKTLAPQLCAEFRRLLPDNAVAYFVSYYCYCQPQAYIARSDTYIEKDSSRNEEIERMLHSTTSSLIPRRDVLVVASLSCIYGIP